jgi:hypothetical protein
LFAAFPSVVIEAISFASGLPLHVDVSVALTLLDDVVDANLVAIDGVDDDKNDDVDFVTGVAFNDADLKAKYRR